MRKLITFETIFNERLLMVNGDMSKIIKPEKPFNEMSTEQLRKYITFFIQRGFERQLSGLITYSEEKEIVTQLNAEWDRRAGADFTKIYNLFDKKENKEEGACRYKLLSYTFKGYGQMTVAKKTKAILNYLTEIGISVDQFLKLFDIMDYFWYWDMTKNESGQDYLNSKNKEYQDDFVEYVIGEIPEEIAKQQPWFNTAFRVEQ